MAILIHFDSHENCAMGQHCVMLEENENTDVLFDKAKKFNLYHDELLAITSKIYEGYLGELTINKDNQKTVSIDDMWLYPDPNYRGDVDNNFYGTLAEWRENRSDIELD